MTERRDITWEDLKHACVPKQYWGAKLASVPESAQIPITKYCEHIEKIVDAGTSIYLMGLAGVGKTSAAVVLVKAARMARKSVYFTTLWRLKEDVHSRAQFDQEQSVIRRCMAVDLLVVDDIKPDPHRNGFIANDFAHLLRSRLADKKATILTGGATKEEWSEIPGMAALLSSSYVGVRVKGENLSQKRKDVIKNFLYTEE